VKHTTPAVVMITHWLGRPKSQFRGADVSAEQLNTWVYHKSKSWIKSITNHLQMCQNVNFQKKIKTKNEIWF
jgi:hypothetical protein